STLLPAPMDSGTTVVPFEATRAPEGRLTTKTCWGVAVGVGEPDRVGLGELTTALGVLVGVPVFGMEVAVLVDGAVRVGVAVRVLVAAGVEAGVLVGTAMAVVVGGAVRVAVAVKVVVAVAVRVAVEVGVAGATVVGVVDDAALKTTSTQ